MGTFYYGAARTALRIDDRVLAHLKVVAVSKLRRREPFMVSWTESQGNGGGRGSIWIHPDIDLVYRFDGSRPAELDKSLLEQMSNEALAPTGIQLEASLVPFWGR